MDPRTNPYAPGAGTIPPELAGRSDLIEKAAIALDRCRNGRASRVGQAGRAKSYAERLFEYPQMGPLSKSAAREALFAPAEKQDVSYQEDAFNEIFKQTQGYPYFLQEWGKHSWQCARQSPITVSNVKAATDLAISELDAGFFRVRFDRLTPYEKKYLRAMADIGTDFPRSGDIAQLLKREVQSVAPIRASLIAKGMIYSPSHGENSFTVPLFNGYMKRVMPNLD